VLFELYWYAYGTLTYVIPDIPPVWYFLYEPHTGAYAFWVRGRRKRVLEHWLTHKLYDSTFTMANRNREEKLAYKKYLVEFMSFRDQQGYNIQTLFTQEQLTAVRPGDIERWMCQK
jgi:hypothetical protein